jgi:hypothetical protein
MGSAFWLILGVGAIAVAARNEESMVLGVLLQLTGGIFACAAWLERHDDQGLLSKSQPNPLQLKNLSLSERGGVLIFSGWVIVFFQIVVRLLSFVHFGGSWAGLNFGKKCADGDCEDNVAFTLEVFSFGHAAQGLFSVFLFHFDSVFLSPIRGELRDGVCALVVLYPVYNIIKRAIKHAKEFSTSSFYNNGLEWAMGFLLGLGIGLVLQAIAKAKAKSGAARVANKDVQRSGKGAMVKAAAGVTLLTAGAVSALLSGLSWGNTSVKDRYKKQDTYVDAGIVILFLLSIGGVLLALLSGSSIAEVTVAEDLVPEGSIQGSKELQESPTNQI